MLVRKSKPKVLPGTNDLATALTFKQIVAQGALEKHARHLAIKGKPALHHPGLTVPESDVVELVECRAAARNAEIDALAAALDQQLLTVAPNPDHAPSALKHRTVDGLTGIVTARAPVIRATLEAEKTRQAELTAWRDEHHIARPAEYPRSKLVHFRWVGVAVTFEAVAQSSLLMPATPDGLVGAIGLALAVSALTTGLGLLIGFAALRYLAASSAAKRVGGWVALPLFTGLLLLVSFYLAHYRRLAGAAGDTFNDALVIEHVLTRPFDLSGPDWLLLLLTLACAAFAGWKGYTASDPIPGYEKVDRAYVDAREDRDYIRADLQGAIAGIKTSTVKPLLAQPKLARIKRDQLLGSYAELQGKHHQATALAQQEAALAQRAIAHFRQINLVTRADGVTPTYFNTPPAIQLAVPPLPADLKERIEAAMSDALADAAKTAEHALHMARMLDHTSDRADEIMMSIDRANLRGGDNPVRDLRGTLEAALTAPSLPRPSGPADVPALPAAKE